MSVGRGASVSEERPKAMQADNSAAIIVDRAVKSYGATRAVDGLSFAVAPGEVFALLGPNGAGKTTTVEMLEGYHAPDSGAVRVLGLDPIREARKLKLQIGVMLQADGLQPSLTARELLRLYAAFFPDPLDPDELLARVGLSESAKVRCRRLSGGQKRRLALAVALIGQPRLVFLDEPTTGMDPAARRSLWDIVLALRAEGRTVLLTTHYMEEAEVLCDRIAIMDHGHILEEGTVEELVLRRFKERAVRFETLAGLSDERMAAMAGVSSIKHENGEVLLYTRDVPATIGAVLAASESLGVEPANLGVRRATLEDVFLDLTGRALRD